MWSALVHTDPRFILRQQLKITTSPFGKKTWAFVNMLLVLSVVLEDETGFPTWILSKRSNLKNCQASPQTRHMSPATQHELISYSAVNEQLWKSIYRSAKDRKQERPCVFEGVCGMLGRDKSCVNVNSRESPLVTLWSVTGTRPLVGRLCMNTRLDIPPHVQTNKNPPNPHMQTHGTLL